MKPSDENKRQYIQKNKCIPVEEIKIDLNENLIKDENYLKRYVSYFDLNPEINFKTFLLIPSYSEYIQKYKYTLNYKDSKYLGYFKEIDEKNLINGINDKIKKLKLDYKVSSNIEYLSKARIMNFLFFMLDKEILLKDYEIVIKEIKNFLLDEVLIFKSPIYLGNIELKYYFFYQLFVEFFYYNSKPKNPNNVKKEFSSIKMKYFPVIDDSLNTKNEICKKDMTEFFKRKNNLLNYIESNKPKLNKEEVKVQNNTEKKKTIELDENEEKKKEIIKANKIFKNKVKYFQKFKDLIINIFLEFENEEEIIEKIKIIYFYILFEIELNKYPNESFLKAFYIKNHDIENKIIKNHISDSNQLHDLFNENTDILLYENIKSLDSFFENINNPFIDNYLCFRFPAILHKNFLEYDEDIYQEFKAFLKFIYKSRLLSDIYYLCPEFQEYEYPFENDNILNEMFKNTYFIPCESKGLHGYTQKNLLSIFIPTLIKNIKPYLERFITNLGNILNTLIHEQLKHYIKAIIFFNSFLFKDEKYIESDEDLENEENKLLKGLLIQKNQNKSNLDLKGLDGGHRTEILLYGDILKKLTIKQAIKMFCFSTWEQTIEEHFSEFKNDYKTFFAKYESKNPLMNKKLNLKEILNNDDLCPFFKKIINKFIDCKKLTEFDMYIQPNFYESVRKMGEENKEEYNEEIMIDPNYEEFYPRGDNKDYSP